MMNIHMKAKNSCQISDYLHSSKNKEYKGGIHCNARFSATRFGPVPRKQSRICQVSVVFYFTSSMPLHSKIYHLNANLQMERMAGQSGCRAKTKREFKPNI